MTPVPLTSESAEQIGRAWLFHAPKIDLYLSHSRDELRMIDGFPAGGEGGSGDNTPTEAAAMARYHVTSTREQIRDDLATIAELSNSLFRMLDAALRRRTPNLEDAHVHGEAPQIVCTGQNGHCGNIPSDHTLTTGERLTELCDDCWGSRCQTCGTREAEGRRVEGQPACGTCYKADLRQRTKAVA